MIVMLTDHDWHVIEKEAEDAGVSMFVEKPLFASSIVDSINWCLGKNPHQQTGGYTDDLDLYGRYRNKNILLVEDIDINREIVYALLEETQANIAYAENGHSALIMCRYNPRPYDLILMDIQMPEMDGLEATRRIRNFENEALRQVPIVAMTANVFKEDINKCMAVGMNGHVGKPLDTDDLIKTLDRFLL